MSSDDVSRKMLNIVRDLAKWQTGIDGVHEPSAKSILSNSKSLTFMSLGLRDAKIKDISSCIQSVATLANEIEVENYNKDDPQ